MASFLGASSREMATDTSRPWGLRWRSSVWFVTLVVTLGVTTDSLVYSIIVPIIPFQLEHLGYNGVSALVGWLLFAYSGGLVAFTPPIAHFSERYNSRRIPLLAGQVALVGAQIMLMEAPKYWVMVLARIIQGISSSVVWVVGLALLCDTAPESSVGRQLGIAMSGLSIGLLVGPPVSGGLYNAFGFRGPFIFGVIITMIDLVGRLLVIERKDAIPWGVDPAAVPKADAATPEAADSGVQSELMEVNLAREPVAHQSADAFSAESIAKKIDASQSPSKLPEDPCVISSAEAEDRLSLLAVVSKLLRSPRALSVFVGTLNYGVLFSSQEPTLPLHLQAVWNFDSSKVGLVYIASVVPTLFSSPLAGWWVDRKGAASISVLCLLLSLPWFLLLIIQKSLAFFIVVFALTNFFTAGIVSPLTAELAVVTRGLDGVGYGHVYGAFNLAYGLGSALGPIIGGQVRQLRD
ncbi:hypothetical protein AcW1_000241 [Taiwanofungus camphoratus]|nr:hypothetical protein AcV5_004141 [Antrodia cinnamomea]KAI0961058.1 hypothetical protein AcV7_000262 [Antrodia cinnamomea]KAI0963050.1 hypothetical protein AcW1_000241 [Antrodia cinnamomea]